MTAFCERQVDCIRHSEGFERKLRNNELFMTERSHSDVCGRIAQVRLEVAGPRGKASFAQKLGLSPSTYAYYETVRVPPAEILVKIADLAGVDLRWLLTGEAGDGDYAPPGHPVVQRAAALLGSHPDAAAPLAAFLDILAELRGFPEKQGTRAVVAGEAVCAGGAVDEDQAKAAWIPVLGRSAAGVPYFWTDSESAAQVTELEELVTRYIRGRTRRVSEAHAAAEDDPDDQGMVQVITLSAPDEADVVSYVSAAAIKARYPDAFAVRIDGESMAPYVQHGDLVLLSPSEVAADGRAAVVQLRMQIGVTCKLVRREGGSVHLVAINEQFAPQTYPAEEVVWALRVLARVRVAPRARDL